MSILNDKKLKLIYVKSIGVAYVYSQNYGNSLEQVASYADVLKSKYPDLTDSDIQINIFSGAKLDRKIHVFASVGHIADGFTSVNDSNFFY